MSDGVKTDTSGVTGLRKKFFGYLAAAFGAVLTTSIYSFVDTVVVGQYEGKTGTAAISCVTPIWNLFISFGILFGIGGSVMFSVCRGAGDERKSNEYFTSSLLSVVGVSAVLYVLFLTLKAPLLSLFGAGDDEVVLAKALAYVSWIAYVMPLFIVGNYLSAFIRNDGNPLLATVAVVSGGVFNIFGDIFFVFGLDMGISGAGLATMIGQILSFCIMLTHFVRRKKCTLRFARPHGFFALLMRVLRGGFAPFIVDFSLGVLVILFNNRIMQLGGQTALGVFGAIATTVLLVQVLFYGVGQALQPLASFAYGAGDTQALCKLLKYALLTAAAMSVIFFLTAMCAPAALTLVYIGEPGEETLALGVYAFRAMSVQMLFMGINVTLGYYFQSVLKVATSVMISLLRGLVLCSALLYLLPAAFGAHAVWWAMPAAEAVTAVVSLVLLAVRRPRTSAALAKREEK